MLNQGSPWIGILIWIATRGKNMKRILLTTTSLVLAAGVAQADVSFSGTAGVALIDDNGASDATRVGMFFESYYDFDIAASAESDNGVSVSVGFDMGAGNKIDYNDDDVLEAQGNSIGDADVTIGYAGWTLAVDQAGIDNLFDDTDGCTRRAAFWFNRWLECRNDIRSRRFHKLLQSRRQRWWCSTHIDWHRQRCCCWW